jgi:hypothetical protein
METTPLLFHDVQAHKPNMHLVGHLGGRPHENKTLNLAKIIAGLLKML